MTTVGLRVDVDTLRGTRDGVPRLLDILENHDLKASFFFSVGPDNMGRHLWRLLNPAFVSKMLRSNAPALYGWDIALAGTCWPGKSIARVCGAAIRATDQAGHEIGLHCWDHHRWQIRAEHMNVEQLRAEIALGFNSLGDLLGRAPTCSAAPAWNCNDRVLEAKESFDFAFNSDCRGNSIFVPVVKGLSRTMQVPTTLPTFDEMIGLNDVSLRTYNGRLLDLVRVNALNVLTIHAEVEGIIQADLFDEFLAAGRARGIAFVPLGSLPSSSSSLTAGTVARGLVEGRADPVAWQQSVGA